LKQKRFYSNPKRYNLSPNQKKIKKVIKKNNKIRDNEREFLVCQHCASTIKEYNGKTFKSIKCGFCEVIDEPLIVRLNI